MDFKGQQLAEHLLLYIVVGAGVVSFIVGYALQSFPLFFQLFAAGCGVATLVVVPDWPFYNRHPLKWLPPLHREEQGGDRSVAVGDGADKARKAGRKGKK